MSEARELLERFRLNVLETQSDLAESGENDAASIFGEIAEDIWGVLVTQPQPEPGAVPELPEYVTYASGPDHYRIDFVGGASVVMALADMDRVVEARERILAARERARRAGS